jgi:hypothetical protein
MSDTAIHPFGLLTEIAPHFTDHFNASYETDEKLRAAGYVASIATDLAVQYQAEQLPALINQWEDWSQAVAQPLLDNRDQLSVSSRAIARFKLPFENKGIVSAFPLEITLLPTDKTGKRWKDGIFYRDSIPSACADAGDKKSIYYSYELPEDDALVKAAKGLGYDIARLEVGKTKLLHRPVIKQVVDFVELKALADANYYDAVAHGTLKQINFLLTEPPKNLENSTKSLKLSGLVYNPDERKGSTPYDEYDEDTEFYDDDPVMILVNELSKRRLKAAAEHTLDPQIIAELLTKKVQPDIKRSAEQTAIADRMLHIITESRVFKDLIAA